MTNTLLSKSKKELAEQHETLVLELMKLWGQKHRMADWVSPLSAVRQLQREGDATKYEVKNDSATGG